MDVDDLIDYGTGSHEEPEYPNCGFCYDRGWVPMRILWWWHIERECGCNPGRFTSWWRHMRRLDRPQTAPAVNRYDDEPPF